MVYESNENSASFVILWRCKDKWSKKHDQSLKPHNTNVCVLVTRVCGGARIVVGDAFRRKERERDGVSR